MRPLPGLTRAIGLITGVALTLAVTFGSTRSLAQSGPTPAPAASSPTPWNTGTAPPPGREQRSDSTLAIRIYDGDIRAPQDRPAPRKGDEPAYAVDVSAVMTHCANGQMLITALVIGGELTPLDARCPETPARTPASTPAQPAPQCDPNRWTCAAAPDK